jgi:NitT/TauT family transport system substrate-binding protein
MKKLYIATAVVILLLSTVLFGCGQNSAVQGNAPGPGKEEAAKTEQKNKEPVSVSLGILKFTTNAPMYIAIEKGFFKEENLDVNIKWFESSNAVNVALVSNNLDVGGTGLTADFYNMMAGGQKAIIVSDKGKEQKGYPYSAVVVNSDSPIKSIEELKGKRIAVSTIGSTYHYMMGRILEKHGISTKDVQWVPMNAVSGMLEALKGKKVDATVLNEPNVSIALKQGYGKVITWVADEIDYQTSGIGFSTKFAANRDAAVRFLKAYLKGARYYYDAALVQKDGKPVKGQNYDEVVKIIAQYTGQPEDVIRGSFSFIDPTGKLNADDIKTQIEWYAKEKLISKTFDPKDFIDTSFLEEALKLTAGSK